MSFAPPGGDHRPAALRLLNRPRPTTPPQAPQAPNHLRSGGGAAGAPARLADPATRGAANASRRRWGTSRAALRAAARSFQEKTLRDPSRATGPAAPSGARAPAPRPARPAARPGFSGHRPRHPWRLRPFAHIHRTVQRWDREPRRREQARGGRARAVAGAGTRRA